MFKNSITSVEAVTYYSAYENCTDCIEKSQYEYYLRFYTRESLINFSNKSDYSCYQQSNDCDGSGCRYGTVYTEEKVKYRDKNKKLRTKIKTVGKPCEKCCGKGYIRIHSCHVFSPFSKCCGENLVCETQFEPHTNSVVQEDNFSKCE